MKFVFNNLILWKKDGSQRIVHFEPNKVNVITGISHTGKTAILGIIDYCLFSSEHKIPESIINENVSWYGISFSINNKSFTICRKAPIAARVSYDYYFSSVEEIPAEPRINTTEAALKAILEVEFSIGNKVQMPFGGSHISSGSKVSLRYFLMFNTVSEDIIEHSSVFFDKQNIDRYREALPRIFDLAVGIDTIGNILARERREELQRELRSLERRANRTTAKNEEFLSEIGEITKKAHEYALIEDSVVPDTAILALQGAVDFGTASLRDRSFIGPSTTTWNKEFDEATSEVYLLNAKLRNAKRFATAYAEYKNDLRDMQDSLKPILHLRERKSALVQTSIYEDIINALERDFKLIQKAVASKTPIDVKISDFVGELESGLKTQRNRLLSLGEQPKNFSNEREKYFFLGEVKAKLGLFAEQPREVSTAPAGSIEAIKSELESLVVEDTASQRDLFIKMFEEIAQTYVDMTGDALANYRRYKPVFSYVDKALRLRKPKSDQIEYIGSSSNYMFLHLYFFLGLHEVILRKNVPFVPSFLIMDQPSRPYYGSDEKLKKDTDGYNIRLAFKLMDNFIDVAISEIGKDFQMIVFEHVPPGTWAGLRHVHLVEEFTDGNALIR